MKAATRRVYDMCLRVLKWASAHVDEDAGYAVLVAQLQVLAARLGQAIADQRNGRVDVRVSSSRKAGLRRAILAGPIANLTQIGLLAGKELAELGKTFDFKPTAHTYVAFQSAARGMFQQAQELKELLMKHRLSEPVLVEFGKMLDDFDAAVAQGVVGRTAHTAATRELDALAKEARRVVRAMDARNRQRFRDDRQVWEQWISARAVLGTPQPAAEEDTPDTPAPVPPSAGNGTPDAGGDDVRPAA